MLHRDVKKIRRIVGYSPLDLNCFAGKRSSPSTWSVIIQPNHPCNDPMGWGLSAAEPHVFSRQKEKRER